MIMNSLLALSRHLKAAFLLVHLAASLEGFARSSRSAFAFSRPQPRLRPLALARSPKALASSLFDDDSGSSSSGEFLNQFSRQIEEGYSLPPGVGGGTGRQPPSKSDFYSDEELAGLLDLHKQLTPKIQKEGKDDVPKDSSPSIPSIHDMVLETIEQTNIENGMPRKYDQINTLARGGDQNRYAWMTEEIKEKVKSISAIASDVDGTLTTSDYQVHPRTKAAIQRAVQAVDSPSEPLQWFFLATGKTRAGAMKSLGPELEAILSQCPGVFIQGLYCVYGDKVIYEKRLQDSAVVAAEELAKKHNLSIVGYDGDNLFSTQITKNVKELHEKYGEPMSAEISNLADHQGGIHKILILDDDVEKLNRIRKELEELAATTNSCVTQALPTMLELLPEGCSKAAGVQKLCEALGVDISKQLLAIGDAENDAGMLDMAAIGVAVGNGCDIAKNAADIILDETNNQGAAGVAIEALGNFAYPEVTPE